MRIPFDCLLDVGKAYEEEGKWIVEGIAATTDFDLQDDIVSDDAIQASASDLLENSTVLINHNPNESMGKVLTSKACEGALLLKILVSKTAPDIWQKIKEGVLNKFSIRGKILEARKKWLPTLKTFAREILKMRLVEVSLVAVPANPKAKALRWYIEKALSNYEEGGGEIETDVQADSKEEKSMAEEEVVELVEAEGEPKLDGSDAQKGFPFPVQLTKEWTEFAKQKGLKEGDDSWDAWVEFCKQQGYPPPRLVAGTRMRQIIGLADKLLADEKDEERKKLLSQIKVIAEGAANAPPAPASTPATAKEEIIDEMSAADVVKSAIAHAALLAERITAIQKIAGEIAAGAESMDAKDLKAKINQLQEIGWKVQEAADVVNVSKSEIEKAGRKVSGARLTKLKTLLTELSKFVAEVDIPGEVEKSKGDAAPPAPEDDAITKKLGVVAESITALSKSLGFGQEEKEGEEGNKSIVEAVGDIAKRLEVLENSPGEKGSLDGQEDIEKGDPGKVKNVFKGLIQ